MAIRPLGSICIEPSTDPNSFSRGGRRAACHVVSNKLQKRSHGFRKPCRDRNPQTATAADLGHVLEKFFEGDAFPTQDVSLSDLSPLHGKDETSCDIAHIHQIQNEIEIELKTLSQKMPKHRCRRS